MTTLVFDIETDGLLPELTRIHSLCIQDVDTGKRWSCHNQHSVKYRPSIEEGLALLADADVIVGHNIIGFDIPAIRKVVPSWQPRGQVRDTIIMARLLWPSEEIKDLDFRRAARGLMPKNLIGAYSLEAWGHRLGNYKGDFRGPWERWTPEMQEYCEQDVAVTVALWRRIQRRFLGEEDGAAWSPRCADLEHNVAWIISRQERRGFAFDSGAAFKLHAKLAGRRAELEAELQLAFPPLMVESTFIPKVNNRKAGYVKGEPFVKRKTVAFSPSSRQQVARRLVALGWKPESFTADGTPRVDDDILESLPFPQAKVLAEYFMVEKRLGQLAEGKEAWLKVVNRGRIHGRVTTNGAVTGRMTHSKPNVAQVPSGRKPYGHECRELFKAGDGYVLLGCDADALELRCLAHFLAKYDGGAYRDTVLQGKKEDGTDMHTLNAIALGLDPKALYDGVPGRELAKTWFYAFIYGAGDEKLGSILLGGKGSKAKLVAAGRRARASFLSKLPAMGKLVGAIAKRLDGRSYLWGLDGRKLHVRSSHAALNTLLQSAGALAMKLALVILDTDLQAAGLIPGQDYEFVANVHDEWQIEVLPDLAQRVGEFAAAAIAKAGEEFGFLCPLKGNFDVGRTWADTH